MEKNNTTSVDEIQNRSDMVMLLDTALENLDDKKYVALITISKKGGVQIAVAGIASELEMNGLAVVVPEMIEGITEATFGCGDCDECSQKEGEE